MAKYVLSFSPDYFTTSLWSSNKETMNVFGCGIQYDILPLSEELVKKLEEFDDGCIGILDWDDLGKGDVRPLDEQIAYYETGKKLLELVRQELGEEFEVEDNLDWIKPEDNVID
ncbi:hypothetical protein [Ruminococcus flavefaciens]|uniref:hypothetical protein n=1 Tax=Ruminococcus flavefaciens TaxID=1265 RepID=UPI00048B0A82|nr:hypothetical protein [Ruminococcus flavefaciens]